MRAAALLVLLLLPQDPPSSLAQARALLDEARAAERKNGDFDTPGKAALAAFDAAVKADPASVDALVGRGDTRAALAAWRHPRGDFTKRAELEGAIADYEAALKLDPARVEAIAGRGFARFKSSVSRFFARVHVDELFKSGLDDLDQAVKLRPADVGLRILRAEALLEKGWYARYRADAHRPAAEAAAGEFREAIKLDPSRSAELEPRVAASLRLAESPVATEDHGAFIVWSKTWEEARREAAIRRVPIFFYVSGGAG